VLLPTQAVQHLQEAHTPQMVKTRGWLVPLWLCVYQIRAAPDDVAAAVASWDNLVYAADALDGDCRGGEGRGGVLVYRHEDEVFAKLRGTLAAPNTRTTAIDVREVNGRVVMVTGKRACRLDGLSLVRGDLPCFVYVNLRQLLCNMCSGSARQAPRER
jgi:hypothetical protein